MSDSQIRLHITKRSQVHSSHAAATSPIEPTVTQDASQTSAMRNAVRIHAGHMPQWTLGGRAYAAEGGNWSRLDDR
eukprot:scaffold20815_cov146-Isochrysis_galbana.AAC.4